MQWILFRVPFLNRQERFSCGLVLVVCRQPLSVAAARTIHGRVEETVGEMNGKRFLAAAPQDLCRAGLNWSRINCLREVARAEMEGEVDFSVLHEFEVERAMQILIFLKGIGAWSA